jgi:hypothetical protein
MAVECTKEIVDVSLYRKGEAKMVFLMVPAATGGLARETDAI